MCFFRLQKKFVTQRLYSNHTAKHTKEQQEYFLLLFLLSAYSANLLIIQ